VEQAVSTDSFIEDAKASGLLVGLETLGEDVGPSAVGVFRDASTIGNTVPKGDDGRGMDGGWACFEDVDALEEGPGRECPSVG
jgi:hypothetical protein